MTNKPTVVKRKDSKRGHVYGKRPPRDKWKGQQCAYILPDGHRCKKFTKTGRFCYQHRDAGKEQQWAFKMDSTETLAVSRYTKERIAWLMNSTQFNLNSEDEVVSYLLRIVQSKYRPVGFELDRYESSKR